MNKRSNLMKIRRRDAMRIMEEEAYCDYHSGRETLRQAEGGGVIATNDQELVDLSKNMSPFIFQWIL